MDNSSPAFSRMISPVGVKEFFDAYWEKDSLHLQRETPHYYDDALTAGDIDRYFQTQHISPHFLGVLKDGEFCPPDQWTQVIQRIRNNVAERVLDVKKLLTLFNSGATVIINTGETAIPSLTSLSHALEYELKCPVQANIYITPPQNQGFAPHFDAHNVFILQIYGNKSWNLYDSPIAAPVHSTSVESFRYQEREPRQAIELHSGDLLYIPRGMVHCARSEKTTSIHVTVGPMLKHWSTLFKILAKQADEDEKFRRLLPHGLSGEREKDDFAAEFTRQARELLSRIDFPAIHYANFVAEQRTDIRGRFTDLLGIEQITIDSQVCRRASLNYSVERNEQWITIRFEGEELILPLFLEAALVKMFEEKPFTAREIEGIPNESGKLALVKRFVQAGFLTIVAP